METRVCKNCGIEKPLEEYRKNKVNNKIYLSYICLKCIRNQNNKRMKQYYLENKEKILEYQTVYRNQNKEKISNYFKEYYQKNRDKKIVKLKEYRQSNKAKINEYKLNKAKNDKIYAFKCTIRKMLSNSFKRKKFTKSNHLEEIVGLNIEELINYLLETFKNNYGYEYNGKEKVHIDHIIPLATAKTENDVVKLCYYTNLQLLKAEDNLKKGAKLEF